MCICPWGVINNFSLFLPCFKSTVSKAILYSRKTDNFTFPPSASMCRANPFLILQIFVTFNIKHTPSLFYVMRDLPFFTPNYIPLQKLFSVVLFSKSLVRLCFSKQNLSCLKGLPVGWNMLDYKKKTYQTKSSTIHADFGSIVEQMQKYNGNKHTWRCIYTLVRHKLKKHNGR